MLRAFRWNSRLSDTACAGGCHGEAVAKRRWTVSRTDVQNLAWTWVRAIAWAAAMLLLTRVQPVAPLAPFALALFAASLAAGVNPLGTLAGCALGSLRMDGFQVEPLCGAAVALAGFLAWELVRQQLQRRSGRASPERMAAVRDGVPSVLACAGVLASGFSLAAGGAWQSLQVLGAAAAAAACAPFFRALMDVRPVRRHLMPEERIGLLALLCALLAGAASVWLPAAVTAAFLGILAFSGFGAGSGACAGLGAGGAMLLATGGPAYLAALGVCGMLAGLSPPQKKWMPAGVLTLTAAAGALCLGMESWYVLCAALAGAAYVVLPGNVLRRARQWLCNEERGTCDPDVLAARLRGETERRLRALSAAFGELSDGYRLPVNIPDEQSLIAEMRGALCEGCSNYAECWAGDDNRTVRFLCQLISEAIEWSNGDCARPLFAAETPPEVVRQCRRGRSIPARLGNMLEDFARTRRAEMKRAATNQLISAQFMQAQMLLCGLADAQARPVRIRGRQAARARAALDRAQIGVRDVMALRGARMEIVATLKRGQWSRDLAERAARQLSCVFGRVYAPDPAAAVGLPEMKFIRLPQLRAVAAASCHSCEAGVPSGDSHMVRLLEGDRLLMMISDGMGSGPEAARESAQTLRLLWQFLSADVSRVLALETVNELMLARSGEDMFATVDLCLIDLATGVAEFSKLAACRSLIARDGEVMAVEGGRLPLGILEKVQPSVCRVKLEPGDVVLMATDGVMDVVDERILRDVLCREPDSAPEVLAEAAVREAERLSDGRRRDDMTALCARISRRRMEDGEAERAG